MSSGFARHFLSFLWKAQVISGINEKAARNGGLSLATAKSSFALAASEHKFV